MREEEVDAFIAKICVVTENENEHVKFIGSSWDRVGNRDKTKGKGNDKVCSGGSCCRGTAGSVWWFGSDWS
jgi:hypothetical protein